MNPCRCFTIFFFVPCRFVFPLLTCCLDFELLGLGVVPFFLHKMRINSSYSNMEKKKKKKSRFKVLPTFFKFILEPDANTLGIPPQFMEHFGHDLLSPVVLKVPSGPAIDVKLVQSVGKAWLGKGWREFRERYSLEFGYMLTFDYHGNSKFRVTIFNQNSVRIEHPSSSNDLGVEPDQEVDEENVYSTSSHAASEEAEEVESDDMEEEEDSGLVLENPQSRRKSLRIPAKCRTACQKALAFHADHASGSPFFIAAMHRSYVSGSYCLHVPQTFASENAPPGGFVTLRIDNGKNWPVKCSCTCKHAKTRLSTGFRNFVWDNNIKEGDACIFELDKSSKLVWNVSICRQD